MAFLHPPFDPSPPEEDSVEPMVLTSTMGLNLLWDPVTDEVWWEDAGDDS